jgi:acyl-CoA thioesterase I
MIRGRVTPLFAVLLAGALSAGCGAGGSPHASGPTSSQASGQTSGTRARSIVALGDSVPRGTNCGCTPYPPLTADAFTSAPELHVTATNDSVAGYTTGDVVHQLDAAGDVIAHIEGADAVEVEVGANDVAYTASCHTSLTCYTSKVPQVERNLTTIVARVHELTGGRPVLVVLLDYWSVWLGGAYAAEQGNRTMSTTTIV